MALFWFKFRFEGGAKKDLLDHPYALEFDCRFRASTEVGAGSDDSHLRRELVVCISQRMVLAQREVTNEAGMIPADDVHPQTGVIHKTQRPPKWR